MMHPRRARAAGLCVALMLLVACSHSDGRSDADLDRIPRPAGAAAPTIDPSDIGMAAPFDDRRVVDPGWDTETQELDGIFLAPGETDGALTFTAAASDGTILWTAERPISCTGFALTITAEGRSLAVLTDTATTETTLAATTASAYDLATGERVWGPIDVPGPYQGPGLVFATPPEEVMGDLGPKVALDPSTGRIAAHEDNLDGDRIVGAYHGTLLTVDDGQLTARDTHRGEQLWRLPLDDHDWDAQHISGSLRADPGGGLALIRISRTLHALVDLDGGAVVGDGLIDAAMDPATGARVVLDAAGLHAYDADGHDQWSHPVAGDATVAGIDGALVYVHDGSTVRAHDLTTGEIAHADDIAANGDGESAVPVHVAATGAAVIEIGPQRYLATPTA